MGSYLPRATPGQAEQFLERTVEALEQDSEASIAAINSLSPRFREDDLYAFVIDLRIGRYLAHGYNLRLLGVEFASIRVRDRKPVGAPILALMQDRNQGDYDYRWKSPVTGKVEDKHALLRKVDHLLVAVGYYQKPQ